MIGSHGSSKIRLLWLEFSLVPEMRRTQTVTKEVGEKWEGGNQGLSVGDLTTV